MLQLAQGQSGQKRKRTPYPLRLWPGTRPTARKGMYEVPASVRCPKPNRLLNHPYLLEQDQVNAPILTRLRFRLPQFGVPRPAASSSQRLVAPRPAQLRHLLAAVFA